MFCLYLVFDGCGGLYCCYGLGVVLSWLGFWFWVVSYDFVLLCLLVLLLFGLVGFCGLWFGCCLLWCLVVLWWLWFRVVCCFWCCLLWVWFSVVFASVFGLMLRCCVVGIVASLACLWRWRCLRLLICC